MREHFNSGITRTGLSFAIVFQISLATASPLIDRVICVTLHASGSRGESNEEQRSIEFPAIISRK